jgi:hypothetical protein
METARRCIYEAESDAERRQYQSDVRSFQALIDERQKEKAALQTARSPIPAVDAAVPYLVALTREFDPGFWAEHWDAVWGRLTPTEQLLLIDMCIKEIPVLYQPPTGAECGKPSGWYNGKAKRVVLPVRYSDFIEGARAAWSRQRMSARKITSRR